MTNSMDPRSHDSLTSPVAPPERVVVQLRVSPEQKQELKARANIAGLSVSKYILSCTLGHDSRLEPQPESLLPEPEPPASEEDSPAVLRRAVALGRFMSARNALREARREAAEGKLSSV